MKEFFQATQFKPESLDLIEKISRILATYARQGYDLSLRQLYYQLVAADLLPQKWADPSTGSTNCERSYKNIGNLVSDARMAGLIDWDIIKDRGRECVSWQTWESIGQMLDYRARSFQIDRWERQPCHIEVMVEKQALEGVLQPVCQKHQISFTANKGYSSLSAMYEAGKRLREHSDNAKDIHVIYLGDHDPSGMDMTRDVEDRLTTFARLEPGLITVHRVALNMPQVRSLKPPENPAKITDSRAKAYIEQFGEKSWELDAIEPRALAQLVEDAILQLRDDDIWNEDVEREAKLIKKIERIAAANQ